MRMDNSSRRAAKRHAPSQAVGEYHGRYVNEHADCILPFVKHERLVEGEHGPRLRRQALAQNNTDLWFRCWGGSHQWSIRCQENNLEENGAVWQHPQVQQQRSVGPVAEVVEQVVLFGFAKVVPARQAEHDRLGRVPRSRISHMQRHRASAHEQLTISNTLWGRRR